MTIRDVNNWCGTCEETCHNHSTICTVCGSTLEAPASTSSSSSSLRTTRSTNGRNVANAGLGLRAVPEFMTDDLRQAGRELNELLTGLTSQVQELNASVEQVIQEATLLQQRAAAGMLPAEAMDPTQQARRNRPMAKKTLQAIPRIVVTPVSSLFHQATLETLSSVGTHDNNDWRSIPVVLGELEWYPPSKDTSLRGSHSATVFEIQRATVILADPRTGKDNALSPSCKKRIQEAINSNSTPSSSSAASSKAILYFDRGDGVTFAQKALLAQQAGAHAVVIGNNVARPWPYVMQDNKGEIKAASMNNQNEAHALSIPVVMIPQHAARTLVDNLSSSASSSVTANLTISATTAKDTNSSTSLADCIICQDAMSVSQTVMKLPVCGHIFHESCAMAWLTQQNTCPYCRQEYPTEDKTYEDERRRREREREQESNADNGGNSDFYG